MTGPCHTPDGDEWVEAYDADTGHETGCRCDFCDEDRAFDARRDDAREAYDDARFDHEIETTKGVHND